MRRIGGGRAVATAVVAVVLVGVAGCGGGGSHGPSATAAKSAASTSTGSKSPSSAPAAAGGDAVGGGAATGVVSDAELVASAGGATRRAQTSRLALTSTTTIGTRTITVTGGGVVDYAQGRVSLTLEADVAGQRLSIDEVTDGATVYLRSPMFAQLGVSTDRPWVKVSATDVGTGDFGATGDPTSGLALLNGADDVRKVGTETLDGVATTHYSATIDVTKALADAPAEARDTLTGSLGGLTSLPFDVWIDDAGRVAQFSERLALGTAAGQLTSVTTVQLFDYGAPAAVTVPAPGRVSDASSLLRDFTDRT